MRKVALLAITAAALAIVAGRADAQVGVGTGGPAAAMPLGEPKKVDEATQARRDEVDRNYRAVRGSIPAQEAAIDPWANMRGSNETKPAAKPAAKTTQSKKPPQ